MNTFCPLKMHTQKSARSWAHLSAREFVSYCSSLLSIFWAASPLTNGPSLPPFLSSALWAPPTLRKWLAGDNHHWQQLFWSPLKWCWKLFPSLCRRDKHFSGPLQIDAVILSSNGLENWLVPITSGVNTSFSAPVGSGPGGPAVDNHCQQKVSQWKVIFLMQMLNREPGEAWL